MTAWIIGGVLLVSLVSGVLMWRERSQLDRLYREAVGLDLPGLIALLPEELRGREFHDFHVARRTSTTVLVALLYRIDQVFAGTPPHIGLELDLATGQLQRVHPEGIGFEVK